jgi:hypothetical protein
MFLSIVKNNCISALGNNKQMIMATVTLKYDARKKDKKSFYEQPVKKQYGYFFGKKKQCTDNEIFACNSMS